MKKIALLILLIVLAAVLVVGIIFVCEKINYKNAMDENMAIRSNGTTNSNQNNEVSNIKGKKINTLLTMDDKLSTNSIWCGTFQLIWNDLKNELAKKDIVFNPQLDVVENLNKEDFNTNMISEDYYYKKYGVMSEDLKQEIEKGIKDKFDETSDILNDFDWRNRGEEDYFLYAMLKRSFEFLNEFDELEKGKFAGKYNDIKYFGINSKTDKVVRNQVTVLYYNSETDFAVILNTKQNDEVILCRTKEGDTFNSIYDNINNNIMSEPLKSRDELKVPNIKINEKTEFIDIENKEFEFASGEVYFIEKAIQTIQFELDKKGGKIKSEAGMSIVKSAAVIEDETKPRYFNFDDTFVIFLREGGKEKPYFAARIEDITKFQ